MNKIIILLLIVPQLLWAQSIPAEKQPQTTVITTTVNEYHPVVGQKVTISYLLAVKGYFNGATRFQLPSLSKARLAQTSQFAINGSTIIDGEKYATQLWQVDLYPEHSGLLELPPLTFHVQYKGTGEYKGAGENNGSEEDNHVSQLRSDSLAVFAYVPEPLKQIKKYIVSSDVQFVQRWSEPQVSYQVGDIIQREITINATDIKSIQIPAIKFPMVDGIQINVQEPKLDDQSNRGEQTASIKQTITYVIKQPGDYQLGGESLNWWHLGNGLQQGYFDTNTLKVSGISTLQKQGFIIISTVILLLLFSYLKYRKIPPSLNSQLKKSLKNKQWPRFIALLYQKADLHANLGLLQGNKNSETVAQLFEASYQAPAKTAGKDKLSACKLKELIK
ncbi:protein BatD [Moritella marina ATCC 15381]|uniref:Protein BatD n=1 Tax=Moritella marina ATCC 15381 TaxID=1202962 RepID=A0A5J6WM48_MORMI|nr:BatD family protein [Moritella marina]QFI38301.1 protein BatD [Moritella marina ATCC 15381]